MDNSRAARGAGVLLMAQAVRVLSNFGGLLILSRILSPTQFGIAAVAMLVVGIGEIIRDAGLATASVREASLTEGQRDALFWVSTSIGLLLAVVLLGVADLIAAAFRMPELGSLLRLLTLVFLANGFSSQYRATLNRQMRYKEMAIVDSVASVIGLVIAIIAALSGFGYWSLGYQVIGTAAVSSALLAAYGHWWPKLPQKGVKIGSVLRFGGSLLVSQIVAYAGNRVDTFLLGLYYSPQVVGYYNRAFQVSVTTVEQVKAPTLAVAVPPLSAPSSTKEQRLLFVSRAQIMVAFVTAPMLAVLGAAAPSIVEILLGPEWVQISSTVTLLAVGSSFQQMAGTALWLFVSAGDGRALRRYTIASTLVKIVSMASLVPFGMLGVAGGYTLAMAITYPIAMISSGRASRLPVRRLVAQAMRSIALAGVSGAVACASVRFFEIPGPVPSIVCSLLVVLGAHLLAALLSRSVRMDLRTFLKGVALVLRRVR